MRNAAWATVGGVLMLVLAARGDAPAAAPAKQIPLDSIYSTSGQKELKTVETGPYVEPANAPAVAAFAWGKDFKSLTKESLIVAAGTKEKPQLLTPPQDADAILWAVVFFGSTGSSPTQFLVKSASWTADKQLSVQFERPPAGPMTMDLKPYVAWIPLGKMTAGQYTLQLVSGNKAESEQTWIIKAAPRTGGAEVAGTQDSIDVHIPVPSDQQMPGGRR